jgi:hypothetical protein
MSEEIIGSGKEWDHFRNAENDSARLERVRWARNAITESLQGSYEDILDGQGQAWKPEELLEEFQLCLEAYGLFILERHAQPFVNLMLVDKYSLEKDPSNAPWVSSGKNLAEALINFYNRVYTMDLPPNAIDVQDEHAVQFASTLLGISVMKPMRNEEQEGQIKNLLEEGEEEDDDLNDGDWWKSQE